MHKHLLKTLVAYIALFTVSVNAVWYEVTSISAVLGNKARMRERALEDAVYQAILFSGADISGLIGIRPYLKEIRSDYQFSGNEIRRIQVLDTKQEKGVIKLTARIDIYPMANACHKNQYRKDLLIGRFKIVSPAHAALGGIFQFGDDFTALLQRQFETQAQSFVVKGISSHTISSIQPHVATMIAEDMGAQYLLIGTITDMTATIGTKVQGKDKINRQLALSIDVLDGKSGEVIYQNIYRDIATWSFEKHSKVDTKTAHFWTSTYGEMARTMSRNILLDLENNLACRATTPEVVSINSQGGQINAGRIHGVKYGDKLSLWHNASFTDQYGVNRTRLKKSDIQLTVVRVYESSAEITISPVEFSTSIQLGDIVTKYTR
ncbi:flagella assembly protein FlgT [Candidatus Enterovibrio escicola]|uniref:Flagellar protein FlgT n=1 Tax=Candidatus Enterovibrio escicola TaxID=1927127 RepID=A0A2A5T1D1_9GAMM|nr:flagella assembly protein FlgT [Candidatus Enterovibrio escacola]PCS21951.1 Flagellar protein FlgT [Candidatus Enterovibrio escacola]